MTEANPTPIGLPHVVFLERAAREIDSSPGTFGQAAFLVLRLVDLLAAADEPGSNDDLFGYQASATGRYCTEQLEPGAAAECLQELVRNASYAHRRRAPGLIAPAMLALATHLDDASHYPEALDVVATLERTAGPGLGVPHAISAALLTGRIERKLSHFDAAEATYARAGELATAAGDTASALLSRLGRANALWGRGNLAEAERWNREVLRDARAGGVRGVEARAEHGLGVVLGTRGQTPDAIPHFWHAFELYESEADSLMALFELGFAFSRLGAVESAEQALNFVVQRAQLRSMVQNAKIELMHCASFRRDRVGFERCRAECAADVEQMAPNILADYHLKVGIGLARFGRLDRAMAELHQAHQIARAHGLHEVEFRIERIQVGLPDCATVDVERENGLEQPGWTASLAEVSTALAGLTI
jgi:tetratricopeptide (TPR) repeat protein